jgi:secreted trypsin-like serine protease
MSFSLIRNILIVVLTFSHSVTWSQSPKIIGGNEAKLDEYPWMVGLMGAFILDNQQALYCGGSLVAERWILTAAHCLVGPSGTPKSPRGTEVYIGDVDLNGNGKRYSSRRFILHPDYYQDDSNLQHNDIALIELDEPVSAEKVNIATPLEMATFQPPSTATILGWGAMAWEWENIASGQGIGSDYPGTLQQALVDTVSIQQCATANTLTIEDYMMCAAGNEPPADACIGDSGGPLVAQLNGAWYQFGITSFGIGCASAGRYGVYTRIAMYTDWLQEYLPQNSAPEPTPPTPPIPNEEPASPVSESDSGGGGGNMGWLVALLAIFMSLRWRYRTAYFQEAFFQNPLLEQGDKNNTPE